MQPTRALLHHDQVLVAVALDRRAVGDRERAGVALLRVLGVPDRNEGLVGRHHHVGDAVPREFPEVGVQRVVAGRPHRAR